MWELVSDDSVGIDIDKLYRKDIGNGYMYKYEDKKGVYIFYAPKLVDNPPYPSNVSGTGDNGNTHEKNKKNDKR